MVASTLNRNLVASAYSPTSTEYNICNIYKFRRKNIIRDIGARKKVSTKLIRRVNYMIVLKMAKYASYYVSGKLCSHWKTIALYTQSSTTNWDWWGYLQKYNQRKRICEYNIFTHFAVGANKHADYMNVFVFDTECNNILNNV